MAKSSKVITDASRAHTDLSMFYAIVALCESGCFYRPENNRDLQRIIAICKRAAERNLIAFDRAAAKIKEPRHD